MDNIYVVMYNNEALIHSGCAIFPTAVAACEMTGSDGKKFVGGGIAVGYEVMVRLGVASGPSAHYEFKPIVEENSLLTRSRSGKEGHISDIWESGSKAD